VLAAYTQAIGNDDFFLLWLLEDPKRYEARSSTAIFIWTGRQLTCRTDMAVPPSW
jgi:hypothetical protein